MNPMAEPRLSVIITTDNFQTIRPVVGSFAAQRDPSLLELVLVSLPGGLADADAELLERFGRVQKVEVPSVHHLARANAAGALAATCPFVCIGETHCFPTPGWTEAMLEAHGSGATAVLCAIGNASRKSLLAAAGYALDYARIGPHQPHGPRPAGIGHNTSYQRSYLLGLGSALPVSFDYFSEQAHPFFDRAGGTLLFTPNACANHLSVAGVFHAPFYRFIVGTKLGGNRRGRWPVGRILLCLLATPILPFILVARERHNIEGLADRRFPKPVLLATMLYLATFKSLGEAFGLIAGIPAWVQRVEADMETLRMKFNTDCHP